MKLILFFLLFSAQAATAQMYQGAITQASGVKHQLKDANCYIYIHGRNSGQADVTFHYGVDADFFTKQMSMDHKSVYIGEQLMGYQYGHNQMSSTPELDISLHYILKIDEEDQAKMIVYYRENDRNFFNKGKFYKLECRASRSEILR